MQQTHSKLIISGKQVEVFKYLKPLFFDFENLNSTSTARTTDKTKSLDSRERSLFRSRATLRRLINSNAFEWFTVSGKAFKPIFITYTFKENITELKLANYIFTKYIQRFNYALGHKTAYIKYVVVPEFQKRGAVHYHAIFFNLPFVDNIYNQVLDLWRQGFTLVKSLENVQDIGNYISKYMAKGFTDKRLVGNKAYFASKNLLKPIAIKSESEIQNILTKIPNEYKIFEKEYPDQYYEIIKYTKYQLPYGSSILPKIY